MTTRTTLDRLFATALLVPEGDEVRFRHELGSRGVLRRARPWRAGSGPRPAGPQRGAVDDRSGSGRSPSHWSAAHDTRRALAASVAAGRQALRTGAAAEAEGHLGRALELWDSRRGCRRPGRARSSCVARRDRHRRRARPPPRTGQSSSISKRWRSWPTSIRCVRRRCGCSCVTSTGSRTAGTTARSTRLPGPSTLDPGSHHHRAPGRAHSPNAALGDQSSPTIGRSAEAIADAHEAIDRRRSRRRPRTGRQGVHSAGGRGRRERRRTRQPSTSRFANLSRCGPGVSARTHHRRVPTRCCGELSDLAPIRRDPGLRRTRRRAGAHHRTRRSPWRSGSPPAGSNPSSCSGRWSEAEHLVSDLADLLDHPTYDGGRARRRWGVALIRQGRLDEARPMIDQARASLARRGEWSESSSPGLRRPSSCSTPPRAATAMPRCLSTTCIDRDQPSPDWEHVPRRHCHHRAGRTRPAGRHDRTNAAGHRRLRRGGSSGWKQSSTTDDSRDRGAAAVPRPRHRRARTPQRAVGPASVGAARGRLGIDSGSATTRPTPDSATPKRSWQASTGRATRGTASR